jgi:cell division protein ZapA
MSTRKKADDKKTLDVTIMGRAYKVACTDEERNDLLAAVALLDRKMSEIKTAGKVASAERIAVMAALNIAHELLQSKSTSPLNASSVDLDSMRRRMIAMQAMLDEALAPQEKLL